GEGGMGEGGGGGGAGRIGEKQQQKRRRRKHDPQAEPVAIDREPVPCADVAEGPSGDRWLEGKIGHQGSGIRLSGVRQRVLTPDLLSNTLVRSFPRKRESRVKGWVPAFAGTNGRLIQLYSASPVQPCRLALGNLDRALGVLATGADIGEHVEDDEIGKRRCRLLADRAEAADGQRALCRLAEDRVLGIGRPHRVL